jgi:hypothetical protein
LQTTDVGGLLLKLMAILKADAAPLAFLASLLIFRVFPKETQARSQFGTLLGISESICTRLQQLIPGVAFCSALTVLIRRPSKSLTVIISPVVVSPSSTIFRALQQFQTRGVASGSLVRLGGTTAMGFRESLDHSLTNSSLNPACAADAIERLRQSIHVIDRATNLRRSLR